MCNREFYFYCGETCLNAQFEDFAPSHLNMLMFRYARTMRTMSAPTCTVRTIRTDQTIRTYDICSVFKINFTKSKPFKNKFSRKYTYFFSTKRFETGKILNLHLIPSSPGEVLYGTVEVGPNKLEGLTGTIILGWRNDFDPIFSSGL